MASYLSCPTKKIVPVMPVPTLYSICFDYIKTHTEDIISLEGIPFSPTIEKLLNYLFTSDTPLNTSILSMIANSHSKELREANLRWTSVMLKKASVLSAIPSLMAISAHFPKFITCLNLAGCNLCDDDLIHLRGFLNLQQLALSSNHITDRGVTLFVTIATLSHTGGMPYLESLELCNLQSVTDKSLKAIAQLRSLAYLNISNTSITEDVALIYLTKRGYCVTAPLQKIIPDNDKFYMFIKTLTFDIEKRDWPLAGGYTDRQTMTLCFKRDVKLLKSEMIIPATKSTTKATVVKKRKLNTTDYFKMVENELLGNYSDD